MEPLLHIKLEGPKIKQFIKEHSSDAGEQGKRLVRSKGTKKKREWATKKI